MQTWKQRELWRCGVAALGVILVAGWARGDDELAGQASWSVPAAEQVRAELDRSWKRKRSTRQQRLAWQRFGRTKVDRGNPRNCWRT